MRKLSFLVALLTFLVGVQAVTWLQPKRDVAYLDDLEFGPFVEFQAHDANVVAGVRWICSPVTQPAEGNGHNTYSQWRTAPRFETTDTVVAHDGDTVYLKHGTYTGTDDVVYTLPTAESGPWYEFSVGGAQRLRCESKP